MNLVLLKKWLYTFQISLKIRIYIFESQLWKKKKKSWIWNNYKSERKNLKSKLEPEFARINFVLSGRQCFAYPDTDISEAVKQLLATKNNLKI